jgi:hypothetical protein
MPVYVLREGLSNVFKIGRTSGGVDGVLRRLRTGNSKPLSLFDLVETEQESACEAFFHRRLAARRVVRGGGWEFFEMESEEHMRRTIADLRGMFEEVEDARCAVQALAKEQCTDILLEPNTEDQRLLERLMRNKEEQEYLRFECELLESQLKRRIGTAAGLRGLATWKTQLTRRYDEKLFRESAPEMYNDLLEKYYCLDTTAWKNDRPEQYKSVQTTYYSPSISRVFKLQKMD